MGFIVDITTVLNLAICTVSLDSRDREKSELTCDIGEESMTKHLAMLNVRRPPIHR